MTNQARHLVVGVYGAFLGLTLVKFGNPVILDYLVLAPSTGIEWVFSTWPIRWVFDTFFGSLFFVGLSFLACSAWAFKNSLADTIHNLTQNRIAWLPVSCLLGWYAWQWVAAINTVNGQLTSVTLSQFTMCLICFAFGLFCLRRLEHVDLLCCGLAVGFLIVLWSGMDQQFGGLEATRKMIYDQGGLENYPEEFLQRISTGRIFGTLFYPNALAGVILLVSPLTLLFVSKLASGHGNIVWGLAVGLPGYFSAACLYWSGSKSGWLIAAVMLLLIGLRMPLPKRGKWLLLSLVGLLALGAFGVRFAGYFQKGATSVAARFDYWNAAVKVAASNPISGTGPGTFQVPYSRLKAPESEMARLVHNDYLQQASDSGIPGFLGYTGLLLGSICLLYRKSKASPLQFAAWLGLFAWALHSGVEFGLYIPAIAWPAFTMLGWLTGNGMDTTGVRK
mgnify:CR=1 FL=1